MADGLTELMQQARSARGSQLETLLYHRSREVLDALLENTTLTEQHVGILLARKDLPRETLIAVSKRRDWMQSYSLKVAVLKHPHTPRHIAVPLLKFIYPFDLLQIASTPGISPELKRLIEDSLLTHLEGLALGQRISLARRGLQRITGGLLNDADRRVIEAALENPGLTEQAVAAALLIDGAGPNLTEVILASSRWCSRRPVRLALLRSKHLSLARFASILPELSMGDLKDLADDPRIASNLRAYVAKLIQKRSARRKEKEV